MGEQRDMETFAPRMEALAKRQIALRYWLLGKQYYGAVEAMEYAASFHRGVRKDGVTPEFSHQVAIVSQLRTLDSALRYPQEVFTAGFLHDVREDYGVSDAEIVHRFGGQVASAVDALTKEFRGEKREPASVFDAIGNDPIASVVKLADRVHNHQSMVGVFSEAKMRAYLGETRTYFFPMIRRARRRFPDQEPVYENLKLVLVSQVELIEVMVRS